MEIQEYRLISNIYTDEFENAINDHLAMGWQLYGSPMTNTTTFDDRRFITYAQAMVLPKKEKEVL